MPIGYNAEIATEFPEDYWHTYVYVNCGWLCCGQCEVEPDLKWAWEGSRKVKLVPCNLRFAP